MRCHPRCLHIVLVGSHGPYAPPKLPKTASRHCFSLRLRQNNGRWARGGGGLAGGVKPMECQARFRLITGGQEHCSRRSAPLFSLLCCRTDHFCVPTAQRTHARESCYRRLLNVVTPLLACARPQYRYKEAPTYPRASRLVAPGFEINCLAICMLSRGSTRKGIISVCAGLIPPTLLRCPTTILHPLRQSAACGNIAW